MSKCSFFKHMKLFQIFFSFSKMNFAPCRAVNPHSLYADPDPAVFLNADPDPGPGPA